MAVRREALQGGGASAAERLGRALQLRPGEAGHVLWACAYFFTLLCGFYLLRPLREEMGIRGGVGKLQWVFTGTFAAMLLGAPLFSALVARLPRARAIPLVYRFFLANLLGFYVLFRLEVAPAAVARAFFVWVSVYNLFVVAVFWSFMADLFTSDQGKRLFGIISAGGSAGALAGSGLAAALVGLVGIPNLVILSAVLLEASTWCVLGLARRTGRGRAAGPGTGSRPDAPLASEAPAVGGTALSGIAVVFRSPYLRGIAAQMLLGTFGATFLYFQQARIVAAAIPDPVRRTALFAGVDLAVILGSLGLQSLATGRILIGLGVGAALALVPAALALGSLAIAAAPTLWVLGAFQALRRSLHYAVERPATQVLYTVVSREEKYKSKNFIDTVVYRGGDAVAGWIQAGLAALGLSLPALSLSALPVAGAAAALGLWLGRRQARLERER